MRNARVTVLITASAALHFALLWIPLGPGRPAPPTIDALDVRLESAAQDSMAHRDPVTPPPRRSERRAADQDTVAPPPAVAPLAETVPETDVGLPPPNAAPAPTASIDFTESDAARTQDDAGVSHAEIASTPSGPVVNLALVISYLRDLIERSKVYPVLARQRGWEGEVLLAFRVVDDGAIQSVHVARSSGNRLLDQSALQTLQHIERVTPELWRNGNDAELQLSVVYRLIKS